MKKRNCCLGILVALPLLGGGAALGLDDGTPDYIRDYGVLDQSTYERLERFRDLVVVDIAEFTGDDATVTIPEQTIVVLANTDPGTAHTLTFPAATETGMDFDVLSEAIEPGQYWAIEFDTRGAYAFYCTQHPDDVRGVVRVEPRQ